MARLFCVTVGQRARSLTPSAAGAHALHAQAPRRLTQLDETHVKKRPRNPPRTQPSDARLRGDVPRQGKMPRQLREPISKTSFIVRAAGTPRASMAAGSLASAARRARNPRVRM